MPISKKAPEGKRISPAELAEILDVIRQTRAEMDNYTVAIGGSTSDALQYEVVAEYAKAGANWWIESGFRLMSSLESLLDRVRRGPPRLPE